MHSFNDWLFFSKVDSDTLKIFYPVFDTFKCYLFYFKSALKLEQLICGKQNSFCEFNAGYVCIVFYEHCLR